MTEIEGKALIRAGHILNLSKIDKDLTTLVIPENLYLHEFYNSGQGKMPLIKFNKKKKSKRAMRKLMCTLNGIGSPSRPYGDYITAHILCLCFMLLIMHRTF